MATTTGSLTIDGVAVWFRVEGTTVTAYKTNATEGQERVYAAFANAARTLFRAETAIRTPYDQQEENTVDQPTIPEGGRDVTAADDDTQGAAG